MITLLVDARALRNKSKQFPIILNRLCVWVFFARSNHKSKYRKPVSQWNVRFYYRCYEFSLLQTCETMKWAAILLKPKWRIFGRYASQKVANLMHMDRYRKRQILNDKCTKMKTYFSIIKPNVRSFKCFIA